MIHKAVLAAESIELLALRPGSMVIDGTLGSGGHSQLILGQITPGGRLLAIDRDDAALERSRARLTDSTVETTLLQGNFADLSELANRAGFAEVQAVLFDLGLSSDQLEEAERGFSWRLDGPLDMRMDRSQPMSAAELVNQLTDRELGSLIRCLGEERWANRIARFIIARRPLETTRQLAEAVEAAIPRAAWPPHIHPATRTFQALRMAVNRELESLERGLRAALGLLAVGGRLAVIAFHSLEDRVVKSYFREQARSCICPPQQPFCVCQHQPTLRLLTRRPIRPSSAEVEANPRSRSARLRVAERIA
ncbi:MAG: 16S rRNA (cytosine(1402)-N(4))-methyltransferase RsmH [Candidatus Dormibacteraceae bacterium]